jgi:hypothetical protein
MAFSGHAAGLVVVDDGIAAVMDINPVGACGQAKRHA